MRKNSIWMLLSMTSPMLWLLLTMMEKIGSEVEVIQRKTILNFLLKMEKKYMCNSKTQFSYKSFILNGSPISLLLSEKLIGI